MGEVIYGIDLSKKVTPAMTREAIVCCFEKAHKEVIEKMNKNKEFSSRREKESFEKLQIRLIIIDIFEEAGADFNNPTKQGIITALSKLREFGLKFRSPEIVEKHYNEIMKIVNKME